jgi:hypothetical protein
MTLLEQVKILYPDFGTTDTAKMLRTRQTTIKKIVDENNLQKNRRINLNDFYQIEKKEIAYVLGLIWSDGYLSKNKNQLSIECISEDMISFKETLDKIGKWSYYHRKRNYKTRNTKPATNAYICDNLLHDFLVENDFLEKSLKSPCKIVSIIPDNLISYFLLGIIDGDGCFYFKEKMANQFVIAGSLEQDWIFFTKFFDVNNISYKILINKNSSAIRVTSKNDIRKIGKLIYFTFEDDGIGLRRKYEKYKLIVKSLEENDYIIGYIKSNKDKSVKYLTNELNISRFRLNKILKSIN